MTVASTWAQLVLMTGGSVPGVYLSSSANLRIAQISRFEKSIACEVSTLPCSDPHRPCQPTFFS